MGQIVLSWIKCNNCKKEFPNEANDDETGEISDLEEIPKYCPFCGSADLDFSDLRTGYYG